MTDQPRLDLVFLWHMHQPDYRLREAGGNSRFALPWTYLHALKDYTDMAAHLERHPSIRAVVNFVPVLLDQIEDYAGQLESGELRDPLLAALGQPANQPFTPAQRRTLLDSCFRSNHVTMLEPYPHYKRLHELLRHLEPQGEAALSYLADSFFHDLVTWYHLVWIGEAERRRQPLLAELLARGEGFSQDDRLALLDLIRELMAGLIPRYRALAEAGRLEISATPYAHPLAPLLIDFGSAREAWPDVQLPRSPAYPGGRTRTRAHLERALGSQVRRFGSTPAGMWPAEGAISTPLLQMMGDAGVRWAACSETVLANTLRQAGANLHDRHHWLYRPYEIEGANGLQMVFRDERLSDLIGFEYSKWHGRDAANHFIAELENIARAAPAGDPPLVCVILDGENAWEYYPYNAYYFFEDLYSALEQHPFIRTTTLAEYQARTPGRAGRLAGVTAGSWVYGTFSTWIGDPEKNHAWELLCAAKQSYDLVTQSGRLTEAEQRAAEAQLTVCESSDWFWWFGGYNPPMAVESFDRLYRENLKRLYEALQLSPPAELDQPISRGGGSAESGGTMRRAT